jgi:predicted nucleic acid-binding protein
VGFLIDTNLWIAVERGKISVADIHAITKQEPLFLSPINLAEIRFGIELMTDTKQKQHATAMLRVCVASHFFESRVRRVKSLAN